MCGPTDVVYLATLVRYYLIFPNPWCHERNDIIHVTPNIAIGHTPLSVLVVFVQVLVDEGHLQIHNRAVRNYSRPISVSVKDQLEEIRNLLI